MNLLALFLIFSVGALQGTSQKGNISPDSGSLKEGVYRNEYFAFSYRVPKHLRVDTAYLKQRVEQQTRGQLQTQTYTLLYGREETILPKVIDTVIVMADEAAYYGGLKDGNAYLRKWTQFYTQVGYEVLKESTETLFGGKRFFRADYKKPAFLFPFYVTAVFTVWREYALGFIFTAGSRERVEKLVASLETLQFSEPEIKR